MKFEFIALTLATIFFISMCNYSNDTKIRIVKNCKIQKLERQSYYQYKQTTIRLLVTTDKGLFVCNNSFVNNVYNNESIFNQLKIDSVYTLRVSGEGENMFFDYPNIIKIIK
jgi:hypothetical protein